MVKFFDINAGKPGDKTPSEPPKKDDVTQTEPKKEHVAEHAETPEHKPEPKPEKEEHSELLRPDFSVPVSGGEAPKTHEEPTPAKPFETPVHTADDDKDDEVMSKAPEIPRATEAMAPKPVEEHSPISPIVSDAHPRKQKIVTAILSIILIVLLALLVSQAVIYFTQTKQDSTVVTPKTDTTPKVTKSTTASADTKTTDTTKTTTPTTTTNAPVSTALTKEKATVRVLNGGGVTGAAGKVATLVKAAGYTVSGTANAKSYTYATTQVLYKNADAKTVADDIVSALKGYTAESKLDDTTPASATEIVVIVGKK